MTSTEKQPEIPQAALKAERRIPRIWLIPLLAVVLAGWLSYRSWSLRGAVITVHLEQGHDIQPGDDVRYRGITVGSIRDVNLADDLGGVVVTAALHPRASSLARGGTRIWVVRPKLDVTGVVGLETVVGPRYLAILPGDGPSQRHFIGLIEPPVIESIDPGDLEIILQASGRSGMRPGAPILYREVPVGTIVSVGLASDGGSVEARAHIRKAFVQLIRPETRFWNVAGISAKVGISGLALEVNSLEALLGGGIALATPPDAGDVVRTGHRFQLDSEAKEEWLTWAPTVAIGSSLLPAGSVMPRPLRAVIGWKQGRWFKSERTRSGWVVQTERGLLGPVDLLQTREGIDRDSVVLEVAGQTVSLTHDPVWEDGRLALLAVQVAEPVWPAVRRRSATQPEDCLAVADPGATPVPLAAARLTPADGVWMIDAAISLDEAWHGACVLARGDGLMVGMVLVEDDGARVALLPEE